MPELRSRARINRTSINSNLNPNPIDIVPQPDTNNKGTTRTHQRRTGQKRKREGAIVAVVDDNELNNNDDGHNNIVSGAGFETTPFG